jgi:hypothetical protein
MMHPTHVQEGKQVTNSSNWLKDPYVKRLSKVWKSNLVRSIRIKHNNLSSIAEYEENDASNHDSEVDT